MTDTYVNTELLAAFERAKARQNRELAPTSYRVGPWAVLVQRVYAPDLPRWVRKQPNAPDRIAAFTVFGRLIRVYRRGVA